MKDVRMARVSRLILVLGLVTGLAGAAWEQCLSNEMTPEMKACCEAMNHDCGAAGAEMGCCPTEPPAKERQHAATLKAGIDTPAPVTGPLAFEPWRRLPVPEAVAVAFTRETLKLPDRPTYLRLSTLLI